MFKVNFKKMISISILMAFFLTTVLSGFTTTIVNAESLPGELVDLALGKTATADSQYNAEYAASYTVDGSNTTRWCSQENIKPPHWLKVDLGNELEFNQIRILYENAYAKDYEIQVSLDDQNWASAKKIIGNDSGGLKIHNFKTAKARYVKINFTNIQNPDTVSIWSLNVYKDNSVVKAYDPENDTQLQHETGRAEADGWSANADQDSAGYMVRGPEVSDIPEGKYDAKFKINAKYNGGNSNRFAKLDVFDRTENKVIGEKEIYAQNFAAQNKYQEFAVIANFKAGNSYEFRVWYDAVAYVKVDEIRVEGPIPSADGISIKQYGQDVTEVMAKEGIGRINVEAWGKFTGAGLPDENITSKADWTIKDGADVVSVNNGALKLLKAGTATVKVSYDNIYTDLKVTVSESSEEFGELLPKMPEPAPHQDYIDLSNKSEEEQSLFVSLQGLVNRSQPRIYVYQPIPEMSGYVYPLNEDKTLWLEEYGMTYDDVTENPYSLITKYKDVVKGLIVYDDKNVHTLNLASTIAGVKDGLICAPSLVEKLTTAYNLPVLVDLRENNFKTKEEVYTYAYNNYWKDSPKTFIVGIDPNQHIGQMRDYVVAKRAMCLWLDPATDSQLLDKFLSETVLGKSIWIGWWPNEIPGVAKAAEYQVSTIAGDWFTNLTLHAGINKKVTYPAVPEKPALENKIYVSAILSDGDNIQYMEHFMRNIWADPRRGEIPVSWTINPLAAAVCPGILDYYMKTATTNDAFISGPSGYGYTYPNYWTDDNLKNYTVHSQDFMNATGIRGITLWGDNFKSYETYTSNMPAVWGLTSQNSNLGLQIIQDKMPVIGNNPSYTTSTDSITSALRDAAEGWNGEKPKFVSIQAVPWNMTLDDFVDALKGLDDRYEVVRADNFFELAREAYNLPMDVVRGKTATASGNDTGYEPQKAIDTATRDASKWSFTSDGDKWLEIDLGKSYKIDTWIVKHAGAGDEDESLNTRDFKLQKSDDGQVWADVDVVTGNTKDITMRTLDIPVTASYLRLYITNPGSDGTSRIYEFEAYGIENKDNLEDLALNKTATADSVYDDKEEANASCAIDGSDSSYWGSGDFAGTHWIKVDLGGTYNIDQVNVNFEQSFGQDYTIQVSTDDSTWTDVVSVTGNQSLGFQNYKFNSTSARYVKINITKAKYGMTVGIRTINVYAANEDEKLKVLSTDPENNATGVGINKTISVQFNKDIQKASAFDKITLSDETGSNMNIESSILGNILTIDPAADLEFDKAYTVTIPADAVKDTAEVYSFSFKTAINISEPEDGKVAAPTAAPAGGTYTSAQTVTLSTATDGAGIYYTTDSSEPTTASAIYVKPIVVSESKTIKAIAVKNDMKDSVIAVYNYTINITKPEKEQVETPTATPAGGTYTSAISVTLTGTTEGAIIYYTADGSEPTTASAVYVNPIAVNTSTVIKAIAVKNGMKNSNTAVFSYIININRGTSGNSSSGTSGNSSSGNTEQQIAITVSPDGKAVIKNTSTVVNGAAVSQVTAGDLDKALEKASKASDGTRTVVIELQQSNVNKYVQKLPAEKLSSSKVENYIQLITPAAELTIPSNMFKQLEVKDSKVIEVVIEPVKKDQLDKEIQNLIGDRPVINLYAAIDGKKVEWNNPSAPMEISVKYTPTAEELKNPDRIVVYYIDGNNKLITIPSGRYNEKTGKVTFTTTHFSNYAIAYADKSFKDVSKTNWASNAITTLAVKSIAEGTTEEEFSPNLAINREASIAWLIRALGFNAEVNGNFDDTADSKYSKEIAIAKALGITNGVGENKFAPNENITRQDLMTLIVRALEIANKGLEKGTEDDIAKYSDASKVSKYAIESVATLVKSGIIVGSGNNINPKGNTTRAEAAVIMHKLYNQ